LALEANAAAFQAKRPLLFQFGAEIDQAHGQVSDETGRKRSTITYAIFALAAQDFTAAAPF
jgi:hypothetical protein